MKKILALLLAAASLFLLPSCTALLSQQQMAAEEQYITWQVPEELIVMTKDNISEHQDILDTLGVPAEQAESYLTQNNMFFTSFLKRTDDAGNVSYPVEMFLNTAWSDYSENVFDFGRLSEEDLAANLEAFVSVEQAQKNGYEVSDIHWVDQGGAKYIMYNYNTTPSTDSPTQYGTQYMTIYNGSIYCLALVSSEPLTEEVTALRDELFSSLGFSKTLTPTQEYDPQFNSLSHGFVRFIKNNVLEVIIIAVLTVGITIFFLYRSHRRKKLGLTKKKDNVVRANYLR